MKNITIQVTEQQEHFLKLFATNHFPDADDNLGTHNPIHIVQTEDERVIDPDYDTADVVKFYVPDWSESYDSAEELIRAYYEDEDCPIKIVSYDEAYAADRFLDIKGEEQVIMDEREYLDAYGIEDSFYNKTYIEKYYRDVAFFLILSEAKRYMEYQKHNLKNPRTYSYSPGYANKGEWDHFYNLLLNMGNELKADKPECKFCSPLHRIENDEPAHGDEMVVLNGVDACGNISVTVWKDGKLVIETGVDDLYAVIDADYCPKCGAKIGG